MRKISGFLVFIIGVLGFADAGIELGFNITQGNDAATIIRSVVPLLCGVTTIVSGLLIYDPKSDIPSV